MQFREITHSDNIWEDICNIFKENEHSLIFFSEDVHYIIQHTGNIIPERLVYELDICIVLPDITFIEKAQKELYPPIIGFVQYTKNLYLLHYYNSGGRKFEHYNNSDLTESIVVIK